MTLTFSYGPTARSDCIVLSKIGTQWMNGWKKNDQYIKAK